MQVPADQEYLSLHATELGQRILSSFPPLQCADDALSPLLERMLRRPYPSQALAAMGVAKRWHLARNANVIVTFSKSWPRRPCFGLIGPGYFMV